MRIAYLHPGVEALGYVKSTTPVLLSSTNFFKVTFSPSLVSTSPPKPSRTIESPVDTLMTGAEPLVEDSPFLLEVVDWTDWTELAFFGGGGAAGSAPALRLRSWTILAKV